MSTAMVTDRVHENLWWEEGLEWTEDMKVYYVSARKFEAVGKTQEAQELYASLIRKIARVESKSKDWRVHHFNLLAHQAHILPANESMQFYSQAMEDCILADELKSSSRWPGWGLSSCFAVVTSLALKLDAQDPGGQRLPSSQASSAFKLARRLSRRSELVWSLTWPKLTGRVSTPATSVRRAGKRVTLVSVASGRYNEFVLPLIKSAKEFFVSACCSLRIVIFTDQLDEHVERCQRETSACIGVVFVRREELGWPLSAMMRYRNFLDSWSLLEDADFLFSIDVDCEFVAPVGEEVLEDLVGTCHVDNAFYSGEEKLSAVTRMEGERRWEEGSMWSQAELIQARKRSKGQEHKNLRPSAAVYERRQASTAHIPPTRGQRYFYSGFFGGSRASFLKMIQYIVRAIEDDLARGVIARVHDESHVNKFFELFPPSCLLTAAYMYPEAAVLLDELLCAPLSFCPRDHMHPWIWRPWLPDAWPDPRTWTPDMWNSRPMMVPRILNLAKPKNSLITGGRGGDSVYRYRLWSSDMHIGPIGDVKRILRALGMEVTDKSLSSHCHVSRTCATDLKVLTPEALEEVIHLDGTRARRSRGEEVRERFFKAYRSDEEMAKVDMIICSHPLSMCELYLPLGKPMLLYSTTRFDLGKLTSREELERWIKTVRAIASKKTNLLLANNLYDAAYINYFTGITPDVIPSLCRTSHKLLLPPSRLQILLDVCDSQRCPPFRQQGVASLLRSLRAAGASAGYRGELVDLRELYPRYHPSDLVRHPAIVWLPYQVSVMSFFERRAMGIPVLVPSLRLLAAWHMQHGLVFERRADWQTAQRRRGSLLPPHPDASEAIKDWDPNDERNASAVLTWLSRADFYSMPHVLQFESLEHLFVLLETTNFSAVSASILRHHASLELDVHHKWKKAMRLTLGSRLPGSSSSRSSRSSRSSYREALAEEYPELTGLY
ncbi:hypothetical protein GUITHDRAFT_100270 [Guillardia theta CCMP2712]|uniref:Uncharacterized protein n=2 Tax=Guillardia theta TaxID=55529 RepID=L1K0P3_GUITC|nr:hypothetical protein GUITHDRAFT_100270 [Guillardia theta CCMP2712]EKX54020.1 hypothetical protein GUITHDRAFT_100270 [Guillardia theta CCMP2712]|eukprot:XP_005841000.1 hypothetical protein GUITHDRAFT_100270 [Guillardia theta CCMP2712]